MIVRRVHPSPGARIDSETETARAQLLEWYRHPPTAWLRLNLVSTVNGSAAGSDGTSDTITSETDRLVLGVIRELSDVVLVGAASVRAEGYRVPRRARLAVLTSSGNLDGHRIDPADHDRLVIVCPREVSDSIAGHFPGVTVLSPPNDDDALTAGVAVDLLRRSGHSSIVCEGGPNLAAQVLEAGIVDELCLTTSPLLTSTNLPLPTTDAALTLTQLLIDEAGSLYSRWNLAATVS